MLFEVYKNFNPRLRVFYLIFAILFLVLSTGLFYRQVILWPTYREQEKKQNQRRILVPGPRGNIYDREGQLLVGNRPRFSAVVYLSELRPEFRRKYIELVRAARSSNLKIDRNELQVEARSAVVQKYLDRVNQILGRNDQVDRNEVERHFRQNLLLPKALVKDLELDDFAQLIEQVPVNSPIQIHTESARYYPYGSSAAHILGFVGTTFEVPAEGVPGDDLTTVTFKGKTGRTGLERQFDEHLQGTSGGEIWVVDPSGFQYQLARQQLPAKGNDLSITIDIDLQLATEEALGENKGALAALNVKTGEVLALASKPDFDLNSLSPYIPNQVYRSINERGAWLNRAIAGLYPPGSSFKIVMATAGLLSGSIDLDTVYECRGSLQVGNRSFPCNNHRDRGEMSFKRAIMKSCNVYFQNVGLRTGVDQINRTARLFGLHQPTGIELPNETGRMIVPNPEYKEKRQHGAWTAGDTANIAIGQGYLLVTPLQMATFMASFARRETRTRTTLLYDATIDPRRIQHGGSKIDLPEDLYNGIVEGMEMAVSGRDRGLLTGSARLAHIPGIRVAGKTGTAQTQVHGDKLTMAWFICFAPIDDPQIAIATVVESTDPEYLYGGGSHAAPVAKKVLQTYFQKNNATTGDLATR